MMNRILLTLLFITLVPACALAAPLIETAAKQAIVIDYDTGAILLEKNADERMPTSSMSKVMTTHVVFEAIKNGDVRLEDTFNVSEKAWRMEGSKMFVEVDKQVKVEDLLRGVIIQSGNDATVVLAEGLAGSEEAFAERMNESAKRMGMNNTHFANASGWPDPNHYSTARDLATLGIATIRDFPEHYPYYAEIDFTYNAIKQGNRNPLLYRNIGADGIKTGHTEAGGYGLIGSGKADGRRVVFVLNGMKDDKERAAESAKILEWALKTFENKKLFSANDKVENVRVVMSKSESIPAVIHDQILVTIPKAAARNFKVTAHFKEPLIAPVKEGQEIGKLTVEVPGESTIEKLLYAGASAERLGFFAATMEKMKMYLGAARS